MDDKSQSKQELDRQAGRSNANFVQFSRAHLRAWRLLIQQQPLAAEILMFLVERMGRTSNAVVCSYKVMQEITGYKRTSVASAIKHLREENWIDSIKVGSATAYAVNERVCWQAARNQRHYAMFSATVVAAESEQPEGFREKAKEKMRHIPFVDVESNERIMVGNDELPPPDQLDIKLT